MTDSIIKLFRYESRLDLLYVDSQIRGCIVSNNSPLNKKIFKLHKGVDNVLRMRVLNPDRKRVSVDHLSIRARFISTENQERVLDRFADLVPNSKGDIRLIIYEADLVDIAAGFYSMIVTGEESLIPSTPAPFSNYATNTNYTTGQIVQFEGDFYSARQNHFSTSFVLVDWLLLTSGLPQIDSFGENVQTPFFLDNQGDIVATVEIIASADVTPRESVELLPTSWTVTSGETLGFTRFLSSAIPGARLQNYTNSVHSFSAATTGFTGTLEARATLDHIPPGDPNDYFPIDITSGTNIITFDDFTGITAHTFDANFMWIIFIYETQNDLPSNGTLDKVLVR